MVAQARTAAILLTVCLTGLLTAEAGLNWQEVTGMSFGDLTFYGQDDMQDAAGACSFSENGAKTTNFPYTAGAALTLALNADQFDGGRGCGLCVMYRGIGGGMGVTPPSTTTWTYGVVNNVCPECLKGSIDQNINGDGRWKFQWYAVPCNVQNSTINYGVISPNGLYWAVVVSNTRVPVDKLELFIDGSYRTPVRSGNNQWVWPGDQVNRQWSASDFPLQTRVTSVSGETVIDSIPSPQGGNGTTQFTTPSSFSFMQSGNVPGYGIMASNFHNFNFGSSQNAVERNELQDTYGTTSDGTAFQAPLVPVPDGNQCGGLGGSCSPRDRGQPTQPCIPGAWPLAMCNIGSVCLPSPSEGYQGDQKDAMYWRCQPYGYSQQTLGGGVTGSSGSWSGASSGSNSSGIVNMGTTNYTAVSSQINSGSVDGFTQIKSAGRKLMQRVLHR